MKPGRQTRSPEGDVAKRGHLALLELARLLARQAAGEWVERGRDPAEQLSHSTPEEQR